VTDVPGPLRIERKLDDLGTRQGLVGAEPLSMESPAASCSSSINPASERSSP
jgi:hypothetical protein